MPPRARGADLVEWSTAAFSAYTKHTQVIQTAASATIGGTFKVVYDTTSCNHCQVKASHTTGSLNTDISVGNMTTALQNLPNLRTVDVTRTVNR